MSYEAEAERLWSRYKDLQPSGVTVREERTLERQAVMRSFVLAHNLACFKCGTRLNDWAKTGESFGRRWAICSPCVRGKRL